MFVLLCHMADDQIDVELPCFMSFTCASFVLGPKKYSKLAQFLSVVQQLRSSPRDKRPESARLRWQMDSFFGRNNIVQW